MKIGGYHIRLKKSCADLFIPILFAAILIYYMLDSMSIMNSDAMLMVKVVAALMALSLVFVIKGELLIQKADDSPLEYKKPFFSSAEECTKSIGFTLLAFLYFAALVYAGFIISTLAYSVAALFFLGVRSIKTLILLPILLTAGTYIMFKIVLLVPLPVGVFGI